jgi:hypothetical protein
MKTSLTTLAVVLAVAGAVFADIPHMISYQGRVTDDAGVPVADGTYDMRFRIYDAETGGTLEWDSGTRSVDVEGGVFNVYLGESPQPTLDLPFDEDYWLLVTFDGVNQTPRHRFAAAGYAYMASGLVPGTVVEGAVSGGGAIEGDNSAATGNVYGGVFDVGPTHSGGYGAGVLGRNTSSAGNDNYGGLLMSWGLTGTGVKGWALATTGQTHGVYGQSESNDGRGVYGEAPHIGVQGMATDATGLHCGGYFESAADQASAIRAFATSTTGDHTTYGIYGRSYASSDGSIGVYGRSSYNNNYGATYGVYGRSDGLEPSASGPYPVGVYGLAGNTSSSFGIGGYFESNAPQGCGVEGQNRFVGVRAVATGTVGLNFGVAATTASAAGVAGWFEGDINVTGDIHKSNCYFLIDHPLDPENKLLRHTCVESPENLLIYRGTVRLSADGEAVVELPGYFEALTDEMQASVHLTPRGRPFLTGYDWQPGYTAFTVYGSPERQVSWMVLAQRDDPVAKQHMRPVVEDKGPDNKFCDRGELLYPSAYGYPEAMSRSRKIFTPANVAPVEEPEDRHPTAAGGRVDADRTSDDVDVMQKVMRRENG